MLPFSGTAQIQVKEVLVCGPRYFRQRLTRCDAGTAGSRPGGANEAADGASGSRSSGGPASASEGGGDLASMYLSQTLYVQRKGGALSYADDPSGVRSLLSRAFHKVDKVALNVVISAYIIPDAGVSSRLSQACLCPFKPGSK